MKKLFKRVIIIDDDPVCRYLNELLIVELGLAENVLVMPDAEAALAYLENTWPVCPANESELILIEVFMPERGGVVYLEKINALAKKYKHPVYILICSTIEPEMIYLYPASPYIIGWMEKPLSMDKLNSFFRHMEQKGLMKTRY
jgi:response regulator of citrate/malate metabolism